MSFSSNIIIILIEVAQDQEDVKIAGEIIVNVMAVIAKEIVIVIENAIAEEN